MHEFLALAHNWVTDVFIVLAHGSPMGHPWVDHAWVIT